jgi:hypothetical protein
MFDERSSEEGGPSGLPGTLFAASIEETLEQLVECPPSAEVQQALELRATTPQPQDVVRSRETLVAELALMLRRTDPSMDHALAFAKRLDAALPKTFKLLLAGDVSIGHAKAIEAATQYLDVDDAMAVDADVADRACTMTVSAFRRIARQAAEKLCSDREERHKRAKRDSGVRLTPGEAGMCNVNLTMPATDGVALVGEVNARAVAAKREGDGLNHGQRQIRAILDAVLVAPRLAATAASDRHDGGVQSSS